MPTLATVTISQQDEPEFLSILDDLNIRCKCTVLSCVDVWRGDFISKYTLDVTSECLVRIQEHVHFICMTTTHYTTTQPLGLRLIDLPF